MLDQKILEMQDEIIRSVQESIRIKSVEEKGKDNMPFGEGVHQALLHCLNLSRKLGFSTVNLDNMIGYAQYGAGPEMVAVLGHLDIVPEGGGWTYPPFGGEIHDGKIYGRGATDDKGPTIGALYALKAIKDLQLPLKRRVRVIFGLNEETNALCVKHYVARGEEMPVAGFTPDGEYPIINGEKGIVACRYTRLIQQSSPLSLLSLQGGVAANVVPDYAEAIISLPQEQLAFCEKLAKQQPEISLHQVEQGLKIRAAGISAHGSTPEKGKSAIALLLLFLRQLGFSGEMGQFLDFFATKIGLDIHGQKLGISSEDEISGKFTFNLGLAQYHGQELSLGINMRYPVTHSFEGFIDTFRQAMAEGGLQEESLRHKPSLYVSPERDFVRKLQKVYEEKTGDTAYLLSIGGGTYAKALPNIVAFGPIFPGQPMVEHKPDEYIKIAELLKNVQIMAAAICELAN